MIRFRIVYFGASVLLILGMLAVAPRSAVYVTWEGIGPDKWASVWLIARHIDPSARIEFLPQRSQFGHGVPFDVPGAEFSRGAAHTTYERLLDGFSIDDSQANRMAAIVRDIEIGAWRLHPDEDAALVEEAFRDLQRGYGREDVPFGCYMAFFDRLHDALHQGKDLSDRRTLAVPEDCGEEEAGSVSEAAVAELPAEAILEQIGWGRQVLFVDVREDSEFAESHIPGAMNLKLREVDADAVAKLRGYDLVVPYCVKDFRGYEVARAMQKLGLRQVAIMNPFGIRGWLELGLPVAGEAAGEEGRALAALERCARDPITCLRGT